MSEPETSPYEAGSDLNLLWGWGCRLEHYLRADTPGDPACKAASVIFRADRFAADAMMRFSVKYPHIIDQVADMLKFTEARYAELDQGGSADDVFVNAMFDLHVRIWEAAETIAKAESGTGASHETKSSESLLGRNPKRKPQSPTIPIYAKHAAKIFSMSKRTFLNAIDSGMYAAVWSSDRKLRLDIDEVQKVDPDAADRLDPAT